MVVKINTPHRLLTALNYNEKKVQQNKAECIYAGNYLQRVDKINFYQKLIRFESQNKLNERAATKTVHISLNFDPKEKLPKEKLISISNEYMEKIGFKDQPFLVYKHNDAVHPHIHIVSSTIRSDGSRINTHNLGRNQSEKARKEIELKFHLVRAGDQKNKLHQLQPLAVDKVDYGKSETKRSISNIVTYVMNTYNYTSLPEFNAALKQYNIVADRGIEESIIFKTGGLLYRILDNENNKIGVPVKASSIFSKPTLHKLQSRFGINKITRDVSKEKIKNIIDTELAKKPAGMSDLIHLLSRKQIYTLLRQNAEGKTYGITFVDNHNKSVFNGSDIAKNCSVNGLQKYFLHNESFSNIKNNEVNNSSSHPSPLKQNEVIKMHVDHSPKSETKNEFFNQLLPAKQYNENIPSSFKKRRKKKKKNHDV